MNAKKFRSHTKKIAGLFRNLGQPARLRILMSIGEGEACVCHLEALLGYRQAYISQHLMALRKDGLLSSRRDGRFIFYRIKDPAILGLIGEAGQIMGIKDDSLNDLTHTDARPQCCCPNCAAETDASLISEALIP